jgi:hypothetical protein
MDFDTTVKVAVYRATAESGSPPLLEAVAQKVGATAAAIKQAYGRLRASRLLLLESDGATIRMAPPFSGVPTQHRVTVGAPNITRIVPGTPLESPPHFIDPVSSVPGVTRASSRFI